MVQVLYNYNHWFRMIRFGLPGQSEYGIIIKVYNQLQYIMASQPLILRFHPFLLGLFCALLHQCQSLFLSISYIGCYKLPAEGANLPTHSLLPQDSAPMSQVSLNRSYNLSRSMSFSLLASFLFPARRLLSSDPSPRHCSISRFSLHLSFTL
jgi:hypothetical protein